MIYSSLGTREKLVRGKDEVKKDIQEVFILSFTSFLLSFSPSLLLSFSPSLLLSSQALARISGTMESMGRPPYTIQRLCEVILRPREMYYNLKKYLFAVEKVGGWGRGGRGDFFRWVL